MTELDTELLPVITTLLADFGKSAVFQSEAIKSYDPEGGNVVEAGIAQHEWLITPPVGYKSSMINETTILTGDMQIFSAAEDIPFVPSAGMKVTFDSTIWRIIRILPIYTGELIGAYEFQLRT